MKRAPDAWIDQYGHVIYARSCRELRRQVENGGSRVSKMYVDSASLQRSIHIGYVVGSHWFTRFVRAEVKS